jgi:hypothetical protein
MPCWCRVCGRKLTSPLWRKVGIGPVCWGRLGLGPIRAQQQPSATPARSGTAVVEPATGQLSLFEIGGEGAA